MNQTQSQTEGLEWKEEARFPRAHQAYAGITSWRDEIFIMGGLRPDVMESDEVDIYNTKTKTWRTGKPMPKKLYGMACCTYQNKIYLMGGLNSEAGEWQTSVLIYDISSNSWSVGTPMIDIDIYQKAAVVGDKAYVVGDKSNQVQIYDFTNDCWLEGAAKKNNQSSAAGWIAIGKEIYYIGGCRYPDIVYIDPITVYDTETDTWADTISLPHGLGNTAVTVVDQTLYVIGGNLQGAVSGYSSQVQTLDLTKKDIWSRDSDLKGIWSNGTAITIGKTIYLTGGAYQEGFSDTIDSLQIGPDEPDLSHMCVLLNIKETVQLSVSDNLINNTTMTWASTNEGVATVDGSGLVTAVDEGTAQIHAANADGYDEYISVKVISGNADDFRLAVDLKIGGNARLYLNDDPSTVTWTSMDPAAATVSASGVVAAVKRGLAIVKGEAAGETYQIYVRVRE